VEVEKFHFNVNDQKMSIRSGKTCRRMTRRDINGESPICEYVDVSEGVEFQRYSRPQQLQDPATFKKSHCCACEKITSIQHQGAKGLRLVLKAMAPQN
jgi:hypothetical protein